MICTLRYRVGITREESLQNNLECNYTADTFLYILREYAGLNSLRLDFDSQKILMKPEQNFSKSQRHNIATHTSIHNKAQLKTQKAIQHS